MNTPQDPQDAIVGHALLDVADLRTALAQSRTTRRIMFLVVGAYSLLFGIELVKGSHIDGTKAIVPIAGIATFAGLLFLGRRNLAKRALESKGERELRQTYSFDAAGYSISSAASTTRAEWNTLHHYDEIPSAFLLFPTPAVQLVVPKRAFGDHDVARLRALLQARVRSAAEVAVPVWRRPLVRWVLLVLLFVTIYSFVAER